MDNRILNKVEQATVLAEQEKRSLPRPLLSRVRRPGGSDMGVVKRAKTQEAAQADGLISVKLLDSDGVVTGSAFDATFIMTDGATAANTCLPRVQTNKIVLVSQIQGTWYVVNPTLTDSEAC